MRKLLVASQKGGVGKTTTSMNLAAAAALTGSRVLLLDADPLSNISTALNLAGHPQRRPLRQAGIDLPGVLVPNFVPGLDVFSPYDEGLCSDDDLDRLLGVLTGPALEQLYGCMIVDVPPFLGGNPSQLIGSCDELLLVMAPSAGPPHLAGFSRTGAALQPRRPPAADARHPVDAARRRRSRLPMGTGVARPLWIPRSDGSDPAR